MTARLFAHVVSLEARKSMSYRADFWINAVVGFVAQVGIIYYLWQAIFRESGSSDIGGYTFHGMMIYYVLVILIGKLVRVNEMEMGLAQDIYEGALTRYLVYPTDYVLFRYAQHLGGLVPGLMQLAMFGAFCPLVFDFPADMQISTVSVLMTIVAVAIANVLNYLIVYPIQGVAFWADNVWSLNVIARFTLNMLGGVMLPITLFPEMFQRMLDYLPFKYLFFFPVEVLLGRVGGAEYAFGLAITLMWIAFFAAAGRLVWRRGYLSYTGVGI